MNPYFGALLFVFLAAAQGTLAHLLVEYPVLRPDLVVLATISTGLLGGPRAGGTWGAVGGLCLDLASAAPLGSGVLAVTTVGFLSGLGQADLLRAHRLLPLGAAFAGTVVFALLHMLLLQMAGWSFNWLVILYEAILPSAVVNTLVMPAVYALIYWLRRRGRPRPEMGW